MPTVQLAFTTESAILLVLLAPVPILFVVDFGARGTRHCANAILAAGLNTRRWQAQTSI
jgi:hypothetical protein